MLGVDERRAKLEDLLGRVQRNRSRPVDERTATGQADIELPPQPKVAIEETAAPATVSEPLRKSTAVQPPKKPVPTSPEPAAVVQEPATAQEVREFTSVPASSGAVAVATGQRQREWTLSAVLERAWKLGSPE